MNTTYVSRNTHQLQIGDIVSTHGSLFRLTERHVDATALPCRPRVVVWFRTVYLGVDANLGNEESIPQHWRDDWTVQGTEWKSWAVVKHAHTWPERGAPICLGCGHVLSAI